MTDSLQNSAKRNKLQSKPNVVAGNAANHSSRTRHAQDQVHANNPKKLQVMKFGGTSVGDASCMAKVVEIVRATIQDSNVVVVVSAMSGVTNKLVEAATQSEAGNSQKVATIFKELSLRHETAASTLIQSEERHKLVANKIHALIKEGERHCQDVLTRRELTLRARDAISGLGERLSAPIVAAALAEKGVASEAIEATEIVVTDSCHGAAEPDMEATRERCAALLHPLLLHGVVAVITGFIGATVDGVPTTLGRNSSDYSGTIVGTALDADEVTLWTDVDGILTADPRLIPQARSIPEMSYHEASQLADMGAKVLHSKTLHPVMQSGIPLLIRNTFAPDRSGTKITLIGSSGGTGLKAVTTASDLGLITVRGPVDLKAPELLRRTLLAASNLPVDVRLATKPISPHDEACIVVSSAAAERTIDALRREFANDSGEASEVHVTLTPKVAIVTIVGEEPCSSDRFADQCLATLTQENVTVLGLTTGSSACSISFVMLQDQMKPSLAVLHRQLEREITQGNQIPVGIFGEGR